MGRTVTLANVRAHVLARYDLQTPTGTSYVNSTVLPLFVNSSIAAYVGILMERELEEYYTYDDTITTTPGQRYVLTTGLPSAQFQGIRDVQWLRGADDVVTMGRLQKQEWSRTSWNTAAWDWNNCAPQYALIRDRIYFGPPPSGAYQLRVFYAGIPNDLVDDGDSFYAGPGWEEFVVSDVCRKIAEREDQDASRFMVSRDRAETALRNTDNRETAGPVFAQRLMFTREVDADEEYY